MKKGPENDKVPVSVDADFARIGSKSFAINKINSVDVKAKRPHSRDAAVLWALLAVVLGGIGLIGSNALCLGLSLIAAALAYGAWVRFKIVEYFLILSTSSAEIAAIKSRDPDFIDDLRTKIEVAMARRTP